MSDTHDHLMPRFAGIDRLYGRGSVVRLSTRRVCIIGLGGVGSWVAEALARSALGHVALVDGDEVCESNVNRQLPALDGQFGRAKVDVLAERMRAISPGIDVEPDQRFLTPSSLDEIAGRDYDLIIDACDAFRVKVELAAWCRRRKQRLIMVGSAGGRSDPTQVRVRDLSRTEHDALLALVRKKLRSEFGFPKNTQRYFGIPAIYSLENVRYPQLDGSVCGRRSEGGDSMGLDCGGGLGAAMHVTAAFAMAATARALDLLLAD